MVQNDPDVDFDKVAARCGRWADRTLAMARALIVDRRPITEVAKEHGVTVQRANMARVRFYEKAEQLKLAEFRMTQAPERVTSDALESHSRAILQLYREGYTAKQITTFLRENGLTVPVNVVADFLKEREL